MVLIDLWLIYQGISALRKQFEKPRDETTPTISVGTSGTTLAIKAPPLTPVMAADIRERVSRMLPRALDLTRKKIVDELVDVMNLRILSEQYTFSTLAEYGQLLADRFAEGWDVTVTPKPTDPTQVDLLFAPKAHAGEGGEAA